MSFQTHIPSFLYSIIPTHAPLSPNVHFLNRGPNSPSGLQPLPPHCRLHTHRSPNLNPRPSHPLFVFHRRCYHHRVGAGLREGAVSGGVCSGHGWRLPAALGHGAAQPHRAGRQRQRPRVRPRRLQRPCQRGCSAGGVHRPGEKWASENVSPGFWNTCPTLSYISRCIYPEDDILYLISFFRQNIML